MLKKIQIILAVLIVFMTFQSANATVVFSDVASNHPNYDAIMYLLENGIIEGYSDNTFRPDQLVNRAEALKIILLGSNILVPDIAEQEIFPDVMHGSWYAKYAAKAKNLGIIKGDDDTGMFRPGDTVNLAEAMKMLLETNDIDVSQPDNNPYWDVPVDSWFAPYFAYAENISLLDESSNENVYPAMAVNRGLLAELMYRLTLKPKGYAEGEASYYGEAFHGKTTASGEIFDASGFTAAHREYPFGTWLMVTNLENGKYTYVRVNDRGPYAGDRIIDLSKAAFESIAELSRGVINVSIIPKNPPSEEYGDTSENSLLSADLFSASSECSKKNNLSYISKTAFDNITLSKDIPDIYLAGEVLSISGNVSGTADKVSAFLVNDEDEQMTFTSDVNDGQFSVDVKFAETGTYKFGILPGNSGTSIVVDVDVIKNECVTQNQNNSASPLDIAINHDKGNSVITWGKNGYNIFKLTFRQNNNSVLYYFYEADQLIPNYPDFESFSEEIVELYIQGANITKNTIIEEDAVTWSQASSISFNAVEHYEYIIVEDQAELLDSPDSISKNKTFEVSIDPKTNINFEGAIILPNGNVEYTELESTSNTMTNSNGTEVYPSSASELILSYKPIDDGIYFAEINNADGLAVINIPLYPSGSYPLIPNPVELSGRGTVDLGSDMGALKNQMLNLVNEDRQDHGKNNLILDSTLSLLAQYRSDDMANNQYFSHYDEEGNSANDIRKNYAISQVVAENIAKDITLELAQYGLMRSAIHRANILEDEWTRVGFGISEYEGGGYIFVQIFSADPVDLNNLDSLRQDLLDDINEVKTTDYSLQNNLNSVAQEWSTRMTEEYFCPPDPLNDCDTYCICYYANNNESLIDNIRNIGVNSSLGVYVLGNNSWQGIKNKITENTQVLESNWLNLGIGIAVDEFGVIKITLIYTE